MKTYLVSGLALILTVVSSVALAATPEECLGPQYKQELSRLLGNLERKVHAQDRSSRNLDDAEAVNEFAKKVERNARRGSGLINAASTWAGYAILASTDGTASFFKGMLKALGLGIGAETISSTAMAIGGSEKDALRASESWAASSNALGDANYEVASALQDLRFFQKHCAGIRAAHQDIAGAVAQVNQRKNASISESSAKPFSPAADVKFTSAH